MTVENRHNRKFLYKRIFDVLVALLAAPVCLLVFVAISIPILIEQLVTGDFDPLIIPERRFSQGREFNLLKFNMFREKARKRYEKEHEYFRTDGSYAYLQKEKGGLRCVGGIMKKYYLDELGQVVNVLIGDMSIVGPRPRPVSHDDNKKDVRLLLKTGIFGFNANRWKNRSGTIVQYATDDDYLECFRKLSPLGVVKLDTLIVVDGLRAIISGKGL